MSFKSIFEKYDVYKECPHCKNKSLIELEEGLFVCDNCGKEYKGSLEESVLNEGPGAGYEISGKGKITSIKNVSITERGDYYVNFTCDASGVVDELTASSYYYGGEIDNSLEMVAHEGSYSLEDNNVDEDTIISDLIDYAVNSTFTIDYIYGGGWSHSTWDGSISDDSNPIEVGAYAWISLFDAKIVDESAIEYIDKAVQGDTQINQFIVYKDGEDIDAFEDFDEAVDFAKANDADKIISFSYAQSFDGDLVDQGWSETVWEKDVDESLKESWSDASYKDYESINKFVRENNGPGFIELVNCEDGPLDTSIITVEIEGDWKHDHDRFDYLVEQWAEKNGRKIIKIDVEVIEDTEEDWYPAKHTIYIAKDDESYETLNSLRPFFNESLDEDAKDFKTAILNRKKGYIEDELVSKTSSNRIKDAYDENNLSIVSNGSAYWFEHCPKGLVKIVVKEMKKYFPDLKYAFEDLKEDTTKTKNFPKDIVDNLKYLAYHRTKGMTKRQEHDLQDASDALEKGDFNTAYRIIDNIYHYVNKNLSSSVYNDLGDIFDAMKKFADGFLTEDTIKQNGNYLLKANLYNPFLKKHSIAYFGYDKDSDTCTDVLYTAAGVSDDVFFPDRETAEKCIKDVFDSVNHWDNDWSVNGWDISPVEYKGDLQEDTIKQNGKWVNKGKEGTHGKFKTKKEADAQRKAMFAQGFKEELEESVDYDYEDFDVSDLTYPNIQLDDVPEGTPVDDLDDVDLTDFSPLVNELNGKTTFTEDKYLDFISQSARVLTDGEKFIYNDWYDEILFDSADDFLKWLDYDIIRSSNLSPVEEDFVDDIYKDSKEKEKVEESLITPSEEDIAEFEAILAKHNFSIDNKGQTLMRRVHYQIRDNSGAHIDLSDRQALRDFLAPLIDDIQKFEDENEIPITWNFGLDKNGIITGGLDLDKKWVDDKQVKEDINMDDRTKENIKDFVNYYKKIRGLDDSFELTKDTVDEWAFKQACIHLGWNYDSARAIILKEEWEPYED